MESNHRRRHIRSLCFRYNTGPSKQRTMQQPVGDSNPCLRLEKPASSTARRTSRIKFPSVGAHAERSCSFQVGREVLESSSPGFQPGAKPSQLPTHSVIQSLPFMSAHEKSPVSWGHRAWLSRRQACFARRHMRSGGAESIFPCCSCPNNWAQNNRG